ncbi:glycosyltransferase [Thermoanaerobacterium thermosaccharolyticum]|uniref:glycosyltransferase n=1 Tax=Thermoanaerobacterium thermosaccharolyticum TaxID=1517 RepID=UPI0017859C61|nr:glycosyltransferase [Thermoanaerobacterium thermosaccharolyticum]MBE0069265.1 glycosyltransferase family 4 protein [Thermoanaerobacterium thermosaccharolyticum]MBE0229051.1 glycosyltransferase family 4 protein [Thermoanaerobacterium thermosaccharolyticum]
MKLAIVHDWLTNIGGAEKVVLALHNIYKDAPVYTMSYNPSKMSEEFKDINVKTSFIQHLLLGNKKHQLFLPFMPYAFEQFDFSGYDVVLTSSSSCAKGIITPVNTINICYCHTPTRYLWDMYHEYIKDLNPFIKWYVIRNLHKLRMWDRLSAERVDYFIANSNFVAKRIKKYYMKDSKVIFPPVDTDFFTLGNNEDIDNYYLVISRLVPYKRIDLAVKAFNQLGLKLKIAGVGSELKELKKIAKPNIEFLGYVSNEEARELLRHCRAFIFPGLEDFGITPVEAQACGRPVVAYGEGGVLDTVIDGKTGILFKEQNVEGLISAVKVFEKNIDKFDSKYIRKHAEKFSTDRFAKEIKEFVDECYRKNF